MFLHHSTCSPYWADPSNGNIYPDHEVGVASVTHTYTHTHTHTHTHLLPFCSDLHKQQESSKVDEKSHRELTLVGLSYWYNHFTYIHTYVHTYIHTYIHTYVHMYIHLCAAISYQLDLLHFGSTICSVLQSFLHYTGCVVAASG